MQPNLHSFTNAPLHALLDANLHQPPEYGDQLTNHLPMALHALHSLGASPQRMQSFYTSYSQRFQGRPAPKPVAVSGPNTPDWRTLRGQADAYPALLAWFNEWVSREGAQAALRRALPDLMPGVAAAAFHGVIRCAHAVQADHDRELAAALAYWAWRWQPLETLPTPGPMLGFDAWAPHLVQESIGWRSSGPLISIRMADASRSTVYASLAASLEPAPSLVACIRQLALFAVGRYVASPNFTVLHMITGLRALRTLLPWLDDSEPAQALLTRNCVAAYLAAQVKPLETPPTATLQSWDAVIAAATRSNDDHVVKLVHACREEAMVYGEGNYLRAATLVTSK